LIARYDRTTMPASSRSRDPRVLVITGAGISAESGVPTFRGAGGYWRNRDPLTLATPEAFARDPALVWDWYRERRAHVRGCRPNAAHDAVVRLARLTPAFLLVTQNVDDLHARARFDGAPLPPEAMVQIHGDLFVDRCVRGDFASRDAGGASAPVPACPRCGGALRPGVVWFGEMLDPRQIDRVEAFLADGPCDAVFVVGTTASFGYIVDWARRAAGAAGRLIDVNPEASPISPFATEVVREPAAVALPGIVERMARAWAAGPG
jgi:NAD-dependent deacetylase